MPSRSPLKPVRPSRESRTEYEGLDPPSGHSVVTEPPLQRNGAGTGGPTSPAVKTSSPCLPPRGADRAVGGIRAEVENSGRRASATNDSTPIPTVRPKSQQFVATATLRRRARQVPTVGCSGATQEPAISRAATCHPVVLGLDPAMGSWRSRPARTNAFETGAQACMPADCGHMRSAANAAETCIHLTTQLVRGRLRDALSADSAHLPEPRACKIAARRSAWSRSARRSRAASWNGRAGELRGGVGSLSLATLAEGPRDTADLRSIDLAECVRSVQPDAPESTGPAASPTDDQGQHRPGLSDPR